MSDLANVFVILFFITGIIVLQVFLSKRENRWLGLILPIISVLFSIFTVLSMMVYSYQSTAEVIYQFIIVFLLGNIPTVILLAIYFGCREKFKKKKEMDKMNIQDLE